MRFGLNTFLVAPEFTDSEIPLIETFKGYGAELIELAIVNPSSITASALMASLEAAGLPEPVVCGAFGDGRDLRGTDEEVTNTTRYLSELIDLAELLGSKTVCGPCYSRTGRSGAHSADEREAQLVRVAEALKPLCDKADAVGVTLAVEPLNRFETDLINTLEQAADLIERVGSPALKIHVDTFHMNIEEADSGAAIRKAGPLVGHVHASASHRGIPGRDQVDWDGVFEALDAIGYSGDVVLESFSRDNTIIARATSAWRDLYESPEQYAVEGLQFLKNIRNPMLSNAQ